MSVFQRIRVAMGCRFGMPPLIPCKLVGTDLILRAGTMRTQPDYDDAWVQACASRGHIIYDVGANVGYDSLVMCLSANVGEIVLVDPNPTALSIAAENLIRNGMSQNARFVCAFVSDKADEHVVFHTVGAGATGSIHATHAQTAVRKDRKLRVRTTTCDVLSSQFNAHPDFVKVDVEGAECGVLWGSLHIAQQRKTRFLVEMHANAELPMAENATRLLAWCAATGYQAWYLKDQTVLARAEQIAHRGRCHVLLQPREWEFPPWLADVPQSAPLRASAMIGCK